MTLRVIIPPAPIMVPTDISSSYAANDPAIIALIAAATEEIDGPEGWLGRAIGPQTLELEGWFCQRRIFLPCPPVIDVVSVLTEDRDCNVETADSATYRQDGNELVVAEGAGWVRRERHRIRYRAGYDSSAVADGGTGPIPARIKQAIIYSVQQLTALGAENLFLSSESVEGIGQTSYVVSPNSELLIRSTMERLLSGLRIYK